MASFRYFDLVDRKVIAYIPGGRQVPYEPLKLIAETILPNGLAIKTIFDGKVESNDLAGDRGLTPFFTAIEDDYGWRIQDRYRVLRQAEAYHEYYVANAKRKFDLTPE